MRTFGDFGQNTWWADKPQTLLPFTMLLLGFIFLSIEDIAVQIEEPFAILPLELHTRSVLLSRSLALSHLLSPATARLPRGSYEPPHPHVLPPRSRKVA